MENLYIRSKIRNYIIRFVDKGELISHLNHSAPCCYVVDENVWKLYHKGILDKFKSANLIILPALEEHKTLVGVQVIYDKLIKYSAKRNLTLISIGGGIIQDLTGFVASTWYRGINWVYVPTTLLGQADSCLGGKTSLNYKSFKNLIGTFSPPSEIIINVPFLQTLSELDFLSGLGEVIKLHLLGGSSYVQSVLKYLPNLLNREEDKLAQIIRDSLSIKYSYVASDEFDRGKRNILNYGHCFGHAIESSSDFQIPHGQAVVLGMMLANIIGKKRGVLSDSTEHRLFEQLLFPVLKIKPTSINLDSKTIIEAMKKDKKRLGEGLALIILKDEYQTENIQNLSSKEVIDSIEELGDKFMSNTFRE